MSSVYEAGRLMLLRRRNFSNFYELHDSRWLQAPEEHVIGVLVDEHDSLDGKPRIFEVRTGYRMASGGACQL